MSGQTNGSPLTRPFTNRGDVVTATDHRFREALADRITKRPLVLVVHSRPTVRQALLVTLDLLGFDVTIAADEIDAVVSIQGATPRALIVEASMWPGTRARVVERLVARREVRRLSVVILGERTPGSTRDSQTSRLSIHRVPRECDINELLDVLGDVMASDVPSNQLGAAS
jgi:CheY-like chemotaxis protein